MSIYNTFLVSGELNFSKESDSLKLFIGTFLVYGYKGSCRDYE